MMVFVRRYLLTGLLIWLPLVVTLWILDILVGWMDKTLLLLPAPWRPDAVLGFHIPGLGAVLAVAVVLVTGLLATNFIGRQIVAWWDQLLNRIPIFRSIYSSVKQVSDTLLANTGQSFRKVVLVEFPQPGQWTLAFIVGSPSAPVVEVLGADHVQLGSRQPNRGLPMMNCGRCQIFL